MSIKQMTLVFNDESIKGNEKLLMIALADNCNDSGVAFPSWSELIRKTSMSRGSVSKWLAELENKNLLFRKSRNRKNGRRTSNKFLIYPYVNKSILDEEDMLIFEDLFIQSSEVEQSSKVQKLNSQSSEVELLRGGQSSELEHLEPSLIINHQIIHHLPDWLDKNAWKKWVLYRTEIKKKLTASTIKEQINFLSSHINSHVSIINTSIMNGWQGLFELKQQSQPKSFKQQEQEQNREQINKALDYNVFDLIEERARQQSQQVVIDG